MNIIQAENIFGQGDAIAKEKISEEKFIPINGIQQWITIKGTRSKPVVLFLHGGPGSPASPYADNIFKEWEDDFIIVQWDQRGTGKTFGADAPVALTPEFLKNNPLSLDTMTADGIALTIYLLKYLEKKKIILFGSSWGSVLGVKMVAKHPGIYYAYIGHSQVVNPSDDLSLYERVYKMASDKNDSAAIAKLVLLGKPPYTQARTVGQLFRVVKKYEAMKSVPPPVEWFRPAYGYDDEKSMSDRENGDDYSFVNYVGDSALGIDAMRDKIKFENDHINFTVPVVILQGKEDILTPHEITARYFDRISAPNKNYILLEETAHGFNIQFREALYRVLKEIDTR